VNQAADADPTVLRLSVDSKATIKVGPFARGGKSRVPTAALDHEFQPAATVTPFGIFLPQYDELALYFTTAKVTSDFIVDRLTQWWQSVQPRFAQVTQLVLNLDNGPENHSHRTQFMKRLVEFAHTYGLRVQLAYYPPYHSKYNPIERCWGVLENHWNGNLLDSIPAVLQLADSMTWKGKFPLVRLITAPYHSGVKLTKQAMLHLEQQFQRLPGLEKYFVEIPPLSTSLRDT
jgi:hypothetical protein